MNELDYTIAEMYPTMKKYLPRLSSFLMNLYSTEPTAYCQKIHHQYVRLMLFSFCNYFTYDKYFTKAYYYAHENLSQEEFINKNYLSFIDGKLYDNTFSIKHLYSLLEDAIISFELPFQDVHPAKQERVDMLIDYILKTISYISQKTDINDNLYLSEYLELCFLCVLKNNLEVYFKSKDATKNNNQN